MKNAFTDEQIISILKEAESRWIPTVDLCQTAQHYGAGFLPLQK
ncbi:hypothetical protein AADA19_07010 [Herbaspirillum huttiense subsp. huttiense]|nr:MULTISPECIES: hypothetical protein [Herbaspirillum]EIJ45554.1 hypothetical protein GWL_25820 [Herbaspirillum sp. GW103]MEE1636227.1 hypothetical protein [Herbaspirillum huttiense NC40101]